MAYNSWSSDWNSITFNRRTGCLHYHVRYFQTWGGSLNGHCGFADDGKVTITQKSSKPHTIYIKGNQGQSLKSFDVTGNDYYNRSITKTSGGEYECYVDFDIPLSQADLAASEIEVVFNGTWWRRGTATDQGVNHTYKVDIKRKPAEYGAVSIYHDQRLTTSDNYLYPIIKIN